MKKKLSLIICFTAMTAYAIVFHSRIAPRTSIGNISVGGLTRDQAAVRLQGALDRLQNDGIRVQIANTTHVVHSEDIGLDLDIGHTLDRAFSRNRLSSLWNPEQIPAPIQVNQIALAGEVNRIAGEVEEPIQDVRLSIKGTTIKLLTDTKPGHTINRAQATAAITHALAQLAPAPVQLTLQDQLPVANPASASFALADAKKMMARPLSLTYEDFSFTISREKIGSWIMSTYDGPQLKATLNASVIAQYVTRVATLLNVETQQPSIKTENGKVTGFTPARVGRAVQEAQLIDLITAALVGRATGEKTADTMVVPVKTATVTLTGLDPSSGITELIGKAVTALTGSPKNRISNIKNGVKYISGTIIAPGEEFSTLKTLGTVDNTTGYLPELVIKGDRTRPDFGGGLCQVSTTLFRAVMNAGLPITARRNHSFRVSYYEKDGDGKFIGPGLDATVYEPDLDFRFRNDMPTSVLIIGYVVGDKIAFEFYGTKDGRSSTIVGPKLLSEVPPGDTKYIQTDALPVGMKKQAEKPHPGGTAIATYTIRYSDGQHVTQEFKSRYRPWPEQFLVGTNTNCSTAAQCALISVDLLSATPFPTTVPSR